MFEFTFGFTVAVGLCSLFTGCLTTTSAPRARILNATPTITQTGTAATFGKTNDLVRPANAPGVQGKRHDLTLEWEFLDDEEGIEIYKGPADDEGTLPFRAVTTLDAPLQSLALVMVDYRRKPEWAPKLAAVRVLSSLSDRKYVFQERYDPPWPAQDRLFNCIGTISSEHPGNLTFTATNANDPSLDEDGCVTSDVQYSCIAMTALSDTQTKVEFIFLGHLGGWIPDWLNNMLQKRWPKKFLLGMQAQACKPDLHSTMEYERICEVFAWLRNERMEAVLEAPARRETSSASPSGDGDRTP